MPEIDTLLNHVVPAAEAAVLAYGAGVLTRVQDGTAEATVQLGQRILTRITSRGTEADAEAVADADADAVRETVERMAEAGDDQYVRALRRAELGIALRDVLKNSPELAAEFSALLPQAPAVHASGTRSVAIGGDNDGTVFTGDGIPPQ
ncbi:hypothetical protein [Streptomyces sp. NPDC060184]|uniref:hypothetical protein n=1 Tax=Streptomyces sp. NPDC060184 TaxID=3347064 RepID=UPI003646E608